MKRDLEPEVGNESRHDADNAPPNLDSPAGATRTRKDLSPLLYNATPTAAFLGLPPEVIYEIFNHCDPASLVQLTKTSVFLRDMLLECSQSMIRLWKQRYTACTGYELPPAADDISVPRLACLIVDESCSLCTTYPGPENKKAPIIIWNARIRCCKACLYGSDRLIYEENLTTFKAIRDVRRLLRPAGFRPHDLFPGLSASNSIYQLFMLEPVERFVRDYERDFPTKTNEEKTKTKEEDTKTNEAKTRTKEETKTNEEKTKTKEEKTTTKEEKTGTKEAKTKTKEEKTKTKEEKTKTKEAKKAWVARKAAEFAKIRKHAHFCKQWEAKIQAEQKAKEKAVRKERLEGILQHLNALGMEAEVRHSANWDAFRALAIVTEPKELTGEAWIHIRDPLLQFVNDLREKRLAHERREIIRQRYNTLETVYNTYLDEQAGPERYNASLNRFEGTAARYQLPQIGDLVTFREAVDLIEGTPVEQPLTEDQIRALIAQLAHAPVDALGQPRFRAWRAGCERELAALLNAADPTRTAANLHLAATIFSRVDDVRTRLQYPAVLSARPGMDHRDGYPTTRRAPAKADTMPTAQVLARTAWSAAVLTVEPARLRLAEQVIRLAGLDPRTATPAEMDARGAWVALESETHGSGGTYRAMMWRYAVLNYDGPGLRSPEDVRRAKFVLLSDEDAAQAHAQAAHAWAGQGYADLPRPHKY